MVEPDIFQKCHFFKNNMILFFLDFDQNSTQIDFCKIVKIWKFANVELAIFKIWKKSNLLDYIDCYQVL